MQLKIILSVVFFVFILFPHITFAADFSVSGKVTDQKNNSIHEAVIIFNDTSGKTVAVAKADVAGSYRTSVPQGTYTIEASGPKGIMLQSSKVSNRSIASPTTIDFILTAPQTFTPQKPSVLQSSLPYLAGGAALFVVLLGGFRYWKNKKASAQTSSSH
jgi:hypothetical protein